MDAPQQQMLLDLKPEQPPTLDNFVVGANAELLQRLRGLGDTRSFEALYIWGPPAAARATCWRRPRRPRTASAPLCFLRAAKPAPN
jgi:DnaA family protein